VSVHHEYAIMRGFFINDGFDAGLLDNGSEDKRQTLFSQIAIEF